MPCTHRLAQSNRASRISRAARAALILATIAACGGKSASSGATPTPASPAEHSLAGLAAQHVAVLPTYAVRIMPGIEWTIGRADDVKRAMDAEIASALEERGLKKQWIFPDALSAAYKRNASYAADPYTLAEEPLRSPSLNPDTRLAEPLATQIRTLVALHQDARMVFAPIELRFEKAGATTGRGVLRVALLDARMSNVYWTGEFASDTASAFGPVIAATIASNIAAAIAPR